MNNQSLEERASHLVTQHTKEEIIKYSRREVLEYLGKVAIYAAELGGLAYFLSACKGGSRDGGSSPTGPTQPTGGNGGGNGVSADALYHLRNTFVSGNVVRPRFTGNTVTYFVKSADPAVGSLTDSAANFWNSNLGNVVLARAPIETGANIVVQIADVGPAGHCGAHNYTYASTSVLSFVEIAVRPGNCTNVLVFAHSFGHALGILHHTSAGVMSGTTAGFTLSEGVPGLFEAVRVLYSRPPGTRY